MMSGFTANYIKVLAPYDREKINAIVSVELDSVADNCDMIAHLV
jgi:hypothetical protein